jgi:hypothetical protein
MTEDLGDGYLSGLPEDQRDELTRVNAASFTALREYLASGQTVAFLGAGASRPLYPLWDGLIGELVDAAADRLNPKEQATCRALARDNADAALRLATRHQLAWHELDALRAHAKLDQTEGVNRGWAAKAEALHKRLVP